MRLNKVKASSGPEKNNRYYNIVLLFVLLAFSACNNQETGTDGKTDSATQTDKTPVIKTDSILIDAAASKVSWTRSKTAKDVKKKIKLGKSTIEVNMDEASFSAEGTIPLGNSCWYTENNSLRDGMVRLKMSELKSLQVDDSQHLNMESPDYLDSKKYPFALLRILEIKPGADSAKSENSIVDAELTIKSKTERISFPATIKKGNGNVPDMFDGKFTIDGKAWGLNPANAKVVKDALTIKLHLVTATK